MRGEAYGHQVQRKPSRIPNETCKRKKTKTKTVEHCGGRGRLTISKTIKLMIKEEVKDRSKDFDTYPPATAVYLILDR